MLVKLKKYKKLNIALKKIAEGFGKELHISFEPKLQKS